MTRALWRVVQRLRFALWQRRRHDRLVIEHGLGFPVVVLPGVLNPVLFLTTEVLVRYLDRAPLAAGCSVLDLGTGSGALAVAAARTAGRVVAVDVNPEAVRCARLNLLLNRVEDRCEARLGDLFDSVAGETFDRVLCNPPFHRGTPASDFEPAALAAHLAPGGAALVLLSSEGDEPGFLAAFRAASLSHRVVAEERRFGERIRVYRVAVAGTTDA